MSITTPKGFVAAGLAAGIKASGALDLALVATDDGVAVPTAATFTSNLAAAAPVQVSRSHLAATGGRATAVLVSSGNANAATGDRGRADAAAMCALAADGLGVPAEEVLVCSTGLIGIPLPMGPITDGIPRLVAARAGGDAAGADAAAGILTTDSGRKEVLVGYPGFTVAGMAKGAGMLAPNMATMLAFLTTDAAVEPGPLADILRSAVADSFNSMSVDGCVGGQEGEHGGHVGGEHARALGHAGHGEVRVLDQHLLAARIGGEDAGRGVGPGGVACGPRGHQTGDAGADRSHRQRNPDQAGGAHQDVLGLHAQAVGGQRAHGGGVGPAPVTGGGVGVPARHQHRRLAAPGGGQVGPAHLHGCGTGQVGGEGGRRRHGHTVVGGHQGEVEGARRLDAGGQSRCDEALRCGDAHG